MSINGEVRALLGALELIGKEWEENYTAAIVRTDEQKVDFLLQIKSLVEDSGGSVTSALIRAEAPKFADQYQQVMLREL